MLGLRAHRAGMLKHSDPGALMRAGGTASISGLDAVAGDRDGLIARRCRHGHGCPRNRISAIPLMEILSDRHIKRLY